MAVPTTRQEFKDYCLRSLGAPVIEINMDDDQVEDRIDEALSYYADYHFDGSETLYYKHQITDQNKTDGYITIPENVLGVVDIFNISPSVSSNHGNMFDIRYQIALNDLYTLTSVSMIPYYMTFQHIQFIEQLLSGSQPIRYSRHRNRLHVDMDWDRIATGDYLVVRAYEVIDPEEFTDVWKDRWLFRYCAQLIKRQWGTNMKKYSGMQGPGGITFNGQVIYDEADREIKEMEKEMLSSYSLPVYDMAG